MAMPRSPGVPDMARGHGIQTRHHAQQRGLAASRRPDEDHEFAVTDGEVDTLDDLGFTKEFGDVIEFQRCHDGCSPISAT
jgi:hypothetical protein